MASTYEPIATTTLGSAQASITISSIPSTYTDLRVTIVGTTASNSGIWFRVNNNSTNIYSRTVLYNSGTSVISNRSSNDTYLELNTGSYSSSTITNFYTVDIFSYTSSLYKTFLSTSVLNYNSPGYIEAKVNTYRSTSAINQINISTGGANLSAGTTVTVYGIKAA